jgi:hypothetical protein
VDDVQAVLDRMRRQRDPLGVQPEPASPRRVAEFTAKELGHLGLELNGLSHGTIKRIFDETQRMGFDARKRIQNGAQS